MKIKVSWIVPKGYIGITLWPFGIYVSDKKYLDNKVLLTHEKIHWEQQKELIGVVFYLWYFIEWFIKLFLPPAGAYKDIGFEREANFYEKDPYYLIKRKRYTWIKFMIKNEQKN